MMERTLLYYPTIDIPRMDWLYSGLLYSDKVSSIVPFQEIGDKRFPETLKYLADENQYKPIFIQELLSNYNDDFLEFEEHFISTTKSDAFCKLNEKKRKISGPYFGELYHQKLTGNILTYLKARGLIKRNTDGSIVTDELVALFYMGILAQYVAKVDRDDLIIPSTDDKRYEEIAFGISENKVSAFSLILEKCLPVPDATTSLKKVVAFKRKRRAELIEFRKFLSRVQERIRNSSSSDELKEIQIETKEAIEKGVSDLQKLCKDGRIKTFFSTFESLLRLENPGLFQSLLAIGAITTPINPIAGVVTGLIGISGGLASSYLSNRKEVDNSEFSYLFKAKQDGLL